MYIYVCVYIYIHTHPYCNMYTVFMGVSPAQTQPPTLALFVFLFQVKKKGGETLRALAVRLGLPAEDLLHLNEANHPGLEAGTKLPPGSVLIYRDRASEPDVCCYYYTLYLLLLLIVLWAYTILSQARPILGWRQGPSYPLVRSSFTATVPRNRICAATTTPCICLCC